MKLFRSKSSDDGRRARRKVAGRTFSRNSGVARRSDRDQQAGSSARDRSMAYQRSPKPESSPSSFRFWLQRAGLLVLLIAIIFSVINVLSLSPDAKTIPVKSSGGGAFLRPAATYQAAADRFLAGSIWNRNKITIDTGRFNKQMKTAFPELEDVSVALPLLAHRPVVYLEPASPAMVLSASNGSFVLDTNGRALLSSADSATTKGLPQVADQSGLQVQLNHQVLAADDVRFIQTVNSQLAAKHVGVASMILPAASSELDVYIAKQPYCVKFNLRNDDARQQAGTYLAAIATLQRQHVTPAQYVDVRLDGRAYYK